MTEKYTQTESNNARWFWQGCHKIYVSTFTLDTCNTLQWVL